MVLMSNPLLTAAYATTVFDGATTMLAIGESGSRFPSLSYNPGNVAFKDRVGFAVTASHVHMMAVIIPNLHGVPNRRMDIKFDYSEVWHTYSPSRSRGL
jgi:hypothetical protein